MGYNLDKDKAQAAAEELRTYASAVREGCEAISTCMAVCVKSMEDDVHAMTANAKLKGCLEALGIIASNADKLAGEMDQHVQKVLSLKHHF